MNVFTQLKGALKKSSALLTTSIHQIITHRKLDSDISEELEEALIMADLGPESARAIIAALEKQRFDKNISEEEIRKVLSDSIASLLIPYETEPALVAFPTIIMVTGVNGNGKTTTVGKLALYYKNQGKKVILAACDTFRAGAISQLGIWAERVGVELVSGSSGADPASVAYKAFEKAKKEKVDIVLMDTAGRLQNNLSLMDELAKIVRVVGKIDPKAPHHIWLVIDATTGQNALQQMEIFKNKIGITGLIVTKLDGTAKGGIIIPLLKRFNVPLHFIGIGEGPGDLKPFNPKEFAQALFFNE